MTLFKNKADIFFEYKNHLQLLDLPDDLITEMDELSETLSKNNELAELTSKAFDDIFLNSTDRKTAYENLSAYCKTMEEKFSTPSEMLNVFLFTAAVKKLSKEYEKLNLPYDILKATLRDIRIWCEHYYKETGKYGLAETGWLLLHFNCQLFRIGRLQYVLKKSVSDCMMFENKNSKKLVAASAGIPLNAQGEWDENFCIVKTKFEENDKSYTVHISENGKIDLKATVLSKDEWSLILSDKDDALEMHIPEDGKLSYDDCIESMKEAQEFYKKYFDVDIKGFTVMSWLADEALNEVLPPESNILKFQKLYDVRMMSKLGSHQTIQRVFGDKWQGDIINAPENTSLQRNVKKSLLNGVKFREYYGLRKAF